LKLKASHTVESVIWLQAATDLMPTFAECCKSGYFSDCCQQAEALIEPGPWCSDSIGDV
jgi:hypothetical protein